MEHLVWDLREQEHKDGIALSEAFYRQKGADFYIRDIEYRRQCVEIIRRIRNCLPEAGSSAGRSQGRLRGLPD